MNDRLGAIEERLGIRIEKTDDRGADLTLEEQVASVSAILTLLETEVDLLQAEQLSASVSAFLLSGNVLGISTDSQAIVPDLTVTGSTNLYDLSVTGEITSGLLLINGLECGSGISPVPDPTCGASISILSGPLVLQPQSTGMVEIMGGKVAISTSGDITIEGIITVDEIVTEKVTLGDSASITSGDNPPVDPCETGTLYIQRDESSARIYFCNEESWEKVDTTKQ